MLSIVGIGVPLLLMMLGWRWWTTRSVMESLPPPEHAVVETDPSSPDFSAEPQDAAAKTIRAGDTSTTDTVDDWVEQLGDLSKGPADNPRATAIRFLVNRQYDKAIRAFDRLLMAAPNDFQAMLGKATALAGAGRFEDAQPLFDRLLEADPDDISIRFNLAVAQMRAGRYDDAERTLRGVLKADPDNVRAAYNLAIVLQAQERHIESIEHWRRLTQGAKVPARLARAWYHRGECALAIGLFTEAIESFDHFLQFRPNDAKAWCNLGIAQARLARYDQAIQTLGKSIDIDATLVAAWNQLANVHAEVFSNTRSAESRQAAIDCANKSLALFANQPTMRAMRKAMLSAKPLTPMTNDQIPMSNE